MCKFITCLKAWKFKMSATPVFPLSISGVPPWSLLTVNSSLCSGKHSHSARTYEQNNSLAMHFVSQGSVLQPVQRPSCTLLLLWALGRCNSGAFWPQKTYVKYAYTNTLFFITVKLMSLQYLRSDLLLSRKTQFLTLIFQKQELKKDNNQTFREIFLKIWSGFFPDWCG